MPATPTAEQVALVYSLLPTEAVSDYAWDDAKVIALLTDNNFSVAKAVRRFWLERVNESAEYLDINGKPLTQIHAQAKDMLKYWDSIVAIGDDALVPSPARKPISFGVIERSYE